MGGTIKHLSVGVVFKHKSEAAAARAADVSRWLDDQGIETLVEDGCERDLRPARLVTGAELAAQASMIVSLGGDGTLLHAAGLLADRSVPILGIHMGSLGFLTPFREDELFDALPEALEGRLPVEHRMCLDVSHHHGDRVVFRSTASNDAVISQSTLARLVDLNVRADGESVGTYKVDGLIISTPTGSTAYSLAAGGPVLTPGLKALCVTPICPHALTQRPLVLPASSRIDVTMGPGVETAFLTVDGQRGHAVSSGDRIVVSGSERPLLLYRPEDRSFFDILRAKMMWGERRGMDPAGNA